MSQLGSLEILNVVYKYLDSTLIDPMWNDYANSLVMFYKFSIKS